ncbi:MAG TPA: flagellar hook protein FlgE [Rhodocyclaceae bacterium]
MGFQQALSGLNSSSKALDVVGNNVSNSGTVGFKSARAEFADVYAASLSGAGASQIGIGNRVSNVAQQFTQGNITSTNNALDVAINGNGMFVLSDGSGTLTYTRNGQFQLDKNGYLVNADGLHIQGYPANYSTSALGVINATSPTNIFIDPSGIMPQPSTKAAVNVNLDARKTIPAPAHASFSTSDPLSYNDSTSLSIYDSLGNVHTLSMYYVYAGTMTDAALTGSPTVSTWQVRYAVDGVANATVSPATANPWTSPVLSAITAGDNVTLAFDSSGKLVDYGTGGGSGGTVTFQGGTASPPSLTINWGVVVGANNKAATPMTLSSIDYSSSTQYGTTFGPNSLTQDGYSSGRLTKISIGDDGIIQGNYSNGQTRNMAQIVLARFTNPNGLQNIGGNQWTETFASGVALVGAPGSSSNGVLQDSALEESTVDLTKELVDMITYQRAYQANAQTIKTQDSLMQTITNLR